jgi:E3 ubiquitin-protein ligase UBR7
VDQADDSHSDASSSGLPPPLITAEDYDALVCRSCVSQIPVLQVWAGTPGVTMVVRQDPDSSWRIIGGLQEEILVIDDGPDAEGTISAGVKTSDSNHTCPPIQLLTGHATPPPDHDTLQGKKRSLINSSPPADRPSVKRSRTSETSPDSSQKVCVAPAPHPIAQAVLAQNGAQTLGAGDIFLSGDWRERWCRCGSCLPTLQKHPYFLEEEETYEPPEDPDSREF